MPGPYEASEDVEYGVRPPLQQRSRQAWERTLAAGVELLREGGYEAFTIAAVCERAAVPPRAIYARVDTKEALFLAVYEHGLAQVREQIGQVFDGMGPSGDVPWHMVGEVVHGIAEVFHSHEAFLKPVLLLSSTHPEVHRRGSAYSQELGENFVALLQPLASRLPHEDPLGALRFCFGLIHSAVVMRTMYGPGFAVPAVPQEQFQDSLADAAMRYLFSQSME